MGKRRISLVSAPQLGPQFKEEASMILRDFYQQIEEQQPTDEEDISYQIAILLEDVTNPQIVKLLRQTDARNFNDFRTAFSYFYSGLQSLGFQPSLFFGEDTVSIEDRKENAEQEDFDTDEEDFEGGILIRTTLGQKLMSLAHSMRIEAKMTGEGILLSKLKKTEPVTTVVTNPLVPEDVRKGLEDARKKREAEEKEREAKETRQKMRDAVLEEIRRTNDRDELNSLFSIYKKFVSKRNLPVTSAPPSPTTSPAPSPKGRATLERVSMSEKSSIRNIVGKGKKRGGRANTQQQIPRQIQQDIRYVLNFLEQYPDDHPPLVPVAQGIIRDIRTIIIESGRVRSLPIGSILREIDDMNLTTIGAIRNAFIDAIREQGFIV